MQKTSIVATLVVCFSLSACGMEWPEIDQIGQTKMIGLSKKKVRACMGAPDRRKLIGSTEIWSYDSGMTRIEGSGFATFGDPRHRRCRINMIVTNGAVSQLNFAGLAGDSLDLGERCVFDVAPCAGP